MDHFSCKAKHWPVWWIMKPFPAILEHAGGWVTAAEHECTLQGLLLCCAPAMLTVALQPLPSCTQWLCRWHTTCLCSVFKMDMEGIVCQLCRQCGHRGS